VPSILPLLFTLSLALPAQAPVIDLYTMGPGQDVFSRFGHAAICVTDASTPAGRCYNYGTADFSTPLPLTWNFLRGRALFWVSVHDHDAMVRAYVRQDRALYRQRLPLAPEEAARLAAALEASTRGSARFYHYHHFLDNCTTRIRDLLASTTGKLREDGARGGPSYRDYARAGFAGDVPLLVVTELLLGRPADGGTTAWQGMFLPEVLRREVERHLGSPPVLVHAPQAPPGPPPGPAWAGRAALALLGATLALLLWVCQRRGRRRVGLALAGLPLGLLGALVWGLAALSTFPELTRNEALLLLWPADLLLPVLPAAWARRYLGARACALALCAAALALGWLVQPLGPLLLLCGAPVAAALLGRPAPARITRVWGAA
jgi:hypothetical protein